MFSDSCSVSRALQQSRMSTANDSLHNNNAQLQSHAEKSRDAA